MSGFEIQHANQARPICEIGAELDAASRYWCRPAQSEMRFAARGAVNLPDCGGITPKSVTGLPEMPSAEFICIYDDGLIDGMF
ncbi:hypothetical protein ACG74X_14040 [Marivita sp. S0852]|uniref:hypothetical protein n=1 Tax=Marivita sp. S0852 TaxID=3373893 RepID=UPI003982B0E0